jgi:hypothetical protein
MNASNLDPNLVAGLVTLVTTLAGFLYHKARGTQQRDLSDLLDEAITEEVHDALEDGETLATIEGRLTGAASKLTKLLGLKLPPYTVNIAVQYGVSEFRKLVRAREANQKAAKEIPGQIDDLAKAAQGVKDAFKVPVVEGPKGRDD